MKIKKGLELWEKAKGVIPGGVQLLSKNPEQFLPGGWPSYYSAAKGIEVRDIDGNRFLDFSIMGVGSCILGYGDPDVNRAVKKAVDSGGMCTLNAPEEVELAGVMLELNPWAEMVRYARTGGEAMAVAVRLARAFSGKDKIAFCGYHGWHDWYLSANLSEEDRLDGHLLPGLKPLGVPRALRGTAFPFAYNRAWELEAIAEKHDLGAIVMEPVRSFYPENGFLEKAREIARRSGAVLVFDEITSGFRMAPGGAHSIFGVQPDIAVYAKAVSNGYPMAVIAGRAEVMKKAGESFISSTYWTERTGPAAALATIKKMREKNVHSHLSETGEKIKLGWKEAAEKHNLKIKISGIPPLPGFSFEYEKPGDIMTLFTREMLERGFLARDSVYVSFCHSESHVKKYFESLDGVFKIIARGVSSGSIGKMLKGRAAGPGFARLA